MLERKNRKEEEKDGKKLYVSKGRRYVGPLKDDGKKVYAYIKQKIKMREEVEGHIQDVFGKVRECI